MTLKQYVNMPMRYKFATEPQMGDALYSRISSSNGDEGRAHFRTLDNPKAQVSNAFNQNEKQRQIDGWNETRQIPTGAWQSKVAVTIEDLKKLSPVPVHSSAYANETGGGYYGHYQGDAKNMHIGISDTDPNIHILAHEIGHAQFDESTLGYLAQSQIARGIHTIAPVIGLVAGPLRGSKGTARALKSLVLALGLAAPTLLSEGVADYKGYKVLQQAGASDEELAQYIKTLMKPQSTYLMAPALTGLTSYLKTSAKKLDGRTTFQGLDISIETDKGNYREWYDKHNDTKGKTLMKYPYGYIRKTEGLDGDHVDCFVGPDEDADMVYVVTTNKPPDFKQIDEEKCMLGFKNAETAKQAFLDHYSDARFFRKMSAMPFADFKEKVLKTANGGPKKVGFDIGSALIDKSPGSFNDQTPGDYLGFPGGSLIGLRKIEGDPMAPADKINKAFRFNDLPMDTSTLDPSANSVASSPGV
jgi:hypothetical protein